MTTFQQRRQQVLQLFKDVINLTRTRGDRASVERLEAAAKRLEEGKLMVVIAGEFKQGKSSLINALIDETGLFPVDVDIATNIISTITYGQQEKISVLLGERGKEKIQPVQRDEIPDYVTEQRNRRNERQARMLIMETPNQKLQEGLILVDTPGIGGLNVEHTDLAYAFIPRADAVLFVSDALAPLSTQELDFVKMIARHCQHTIFVITKIDAVGDYRSIVENNREKLAQVLDKPGSAISIVPVSSRTKLAYLKSQDAEDLEDSKFPDLEHCLWQLLNQQRGQILLVRALSELNRDLTELQLPLQTEWESYQQRTQQELDDLEQQFEEARSQSQSLLSSSANWRTQLSDGLADVRSDVMDAFQAGFAEIRYRTDQYLEDNRLIENPEQIAGLIEVDIDALISDIGKSLSRQAAILHAQIEAYSGLNLNLKVGPLNRDKTKFSTAGIQIQKTGAWEKALDVSRASTFSAGTGSALGSMIGGAIGGTIGLLFGFIGSAPGATIGAWIGGTLGGVGGASTGVKQSLRQVQEKDAMYLKREISKQIRPYIEQNQRICISSVGDALKQLERSMRDELIGQIDRQKETFDRSLKSIQQSRRLSQEQVALKVAQLKAPLEQLNRLQQSIEELTKSLIDL
jgi:GTP-binding protein EngB required for normal cell division